MKHYACPVCHINEGIISPQRYLKPCKICQKAIDGASGNKWVQYGNTLVHPDIAKRLDKQIEQETRYIKKLDDAKEVQNEQ